MHPGVLRALEFDRIVEAVRELALTPMGNERIAGLTPSTDPQKVAYQLAATTEAANFIAAHGTFPLRASADLPQLFVSLAIEGRPLEPKRLLALADFLDSIDETSSTIRHFARSLPLLAEVTASVRSFESEITETRHKIDASGEVVDDASPQLGALRDKLRQQRARLRKTLESYLRGRETAKFLQDQVVTDRNGRYVLLVKAEHRNAIPGIVHGASASGASLFLEPLSTVEINNDIVALEEQEAEEVRRILLALTDAFRARPAELQRTIDVSIELDVRQARGRFSHALDAIEPDLSNEGAFELRGARHPLLKAPVPISIAILPPATTLLITGPNTGGKTVALKTAGLLSLMAQSGLRIPAAGGSRLPVFRSIFADIGDEQSIEANLSTFSGHITNIASMDRSLATPSLMLLDEVGSGTDPIEGGALGVAIVDHFRQRGAIVVATSHYNALKTYASTTDGVVSAAFGFDADSFAPTYELVYGSPGRSLALEIASRLGLAPAIIEAARGNVGTRDAQLAEHLARVEQDMRTLDSERRLMVRERHALETTEARIRLREDALRQREEVSKRRLLEEFEAQVRRARREIDDIVGSLKTKVEVMARESGRRPVTTGTTGAVRAEARSAVDEVLQHVLEPASGPIATPPDTDRSPVVGDHVLVGALGLEGVVTSVHSDDLELDVRGKRMRADVRGVQIVTRANTQTRPVTVHVDLQPREDSQVDLNVIGCTVDEALSRAERFLDESLLSDQRVVRFIHGYGTGQLKRALTGFLRQHPLVASFATAPPDQGGGGVTLVELKD